MKRIIFILLLIFSIPSISYAQRINGQRTTRESVFVVIPQEPKEPKVRKKIPAKYQGDLGLGLAFNKYSNSRSHDMTEWYKEKYTSIYLETVHGALISKYFFIGGGLQFETDFKAIWLPIFINTKGIYPINDKWSAYITASCGIECIEEGVYLNGGLGLQYKRYFLDAGYVNYDICYSDGDYTHGFFIKLGVKF